MKQRFDVIVRGTVDYESQAALESAVNEKLAAVTSFTQTYGAYEVWQDNDGHARDFDGKKRFTLQINGNILADDRAAVQKIIDAFCTAYPEFEETYCSISAWMDGAAIMEWNDDGTRYVAPETENSSDVEVEEV